MTEFDNLFAKEQSSPTNQQKDGWKVLIVDDEEDVHSVTKLALSDFSFAGKGLYFIHAYSGAEALQLFQQNRDTCLILLDVVMESQNAGLKVVEQIRDVIQDETVRIILRTGHPGSAPELSVAQAYDISDYKTKSELTAQKLSSALITSLKTHRLLVKLEEKQHSLQRLNLLLKEQASEIIEKKMMIEAIINHAADQAILATDTQQIIRYYNSKAAEFFAIPVTEAIGKPLNVFLLQQEISNTTMQEELALANNGQQARIPLTASNGTPSFFNLTATFDSTGINIGLILMAHTDTKETKKNIASPSVKTVTPVANEKNISLPGFIGNHASMQQVFRLIHDLANYAVPVLIQGESGSGKELVAHSIHSISQRSNKTYLPINCGALPEHLLESELFGHEKGAFTGAIRTRKGLFEQADGGTLFLDEIGEISLAMQVKLLRVIQEGTLQRLGGERTIQVDVRIISATNKELLQETEAGRFREDLYYRLCVVPINLPPLRKRRSDIPLLVHHFVQQIQKQEGQAHDITLSEQALEVLSSYHWPGNARELQNAIHFATVLCHGKEIEAHHLPPNLSQNVLPQEQIALQNGGAIKGGSIDEQSILAALSKTDNNRQEAAKLLGVSRATFYRYLAKFDPAKTP